MLRAAVPAAVVVVLLSACGTGGSEPSGLPTVGGSSAAGPTSSVSARPTASASSPAPDPSPWTALPTISEGPNKGLHTGIVLGSSVARTDEERAAVDAYVAYWAVLSKVGYEAKVSNDEIRAVASGAPVKDLKSYAASLREKYARTVGWAALHITKVTLLPSGALVKACVDNATFDVDRSSGRALEKPSADFDNEAGLRQIDGALLVTSSASSDRKDSCDTGTTG